MTIAVKPVYWSSGMVARRYGKCVRTIDRWLVDPAVNFPNPDLVIHNRRHWTEATLDKHDREMQERQRAAFDTGNAPKKAKPSRATSAIEAAPSNKTGTQRAAP